MARHGLDYKELAKIATELLKQYKVIPSLELIREALPTTTSNSTLVKYVRQWKDERILMSAELQSGQLQLSAGNISKHFEEIWQDLNKAREEAIEQEKSEHLQKMAALKTQLETIIQDLKKTEEDNQLLHKKCNEYQLKELKQNGQIRALEKENELLHEKLQQTERLFPNLRDETQKRIRDLQTSYKEAQLNFMAAEEQLKQQQAAQLEALTNQLNQSVAAQADAQHQFQRERDKLEERYLTRNNDYYTIQHDYTVLSTQYDELQKRVEQTSEFSKILAHGLNAILAGQTDLQRGLHHREKADDRLFEKIGALEVQIKKMVHKPSTKRSKHEKIPQKIG